MRERDGDAIWQATPFLLQGELTANQGYLREAQDPEADNGKDETPAARGAWLNPPDDEHNPGRGDRQADQRAGQQCWKAC